MDDQNTPGPTDGTETGSEVGGPEVGGTPAGPTEPHGAPGDEELSGERVATGPDVAVAGDVPEEPVYGSAPEFEQLQDPGSPGQTAPLAMLYDLDLPVAIELGRTRMAVQDVLALSRGSVVQLDRQAGEPVDVYVGDKRFAEAEVVIVGEQFGVRITRLVSNAGLPQTG